jgi:hypothetical protein
MLAVSCASFETDHEKDHTVAALKAEIQCLKVRSAPAHAIRNAILIGKIDTGGYQGLARDGGKNAAAMALGRMELHLGGGCKRTAQNTALARRMAVGPPCGFGDCPSEAPARSRPCHLNFHRTSEANGSLKLQLLRADSPYLRSSVQSSQEVCAMLVCTSERDIK